MKKQTYATKFWWLLIRSLIITPLIIGVSAPFGFAWWYAALPAFLFNFVYWYRYNAKNHVTQGWTRQIQAQLIALTYYLGIYIIVMIASGLSYLNVPVFYPFTIFPYNISAVISGGYGLYGFLPWLFIWGFWSGVLGVWTYKLRHTKQWRFPKKYNIGLLVVLVISFSPILMHSVRSERYISPSDPYASNSSEVNMRRYQPFMEKSKVAKLKEEPTVKFSSGFPKINGATAAYPVESAIAQALYSKATASQGPKLVKSDSTPTAFASLLDHKADVILMAKPSSQQLQVAKRRHIGLRQTHIANEAFIFFVNRKNPVDNLTSRQIQRIYQRKIVSWVQVGGHLSTIQAFQRPANSGSQTAMETLVMQNRSMAKPLRTQEVDTMGGIVDDVGSYNNSHKAIGYSFRFYATQMKLNHKVKLLKINGVAPTISNIRNGKYPYIASVYAITRSDATTHTRELVNWTASAQGQRLINRTGYVGVR